MHTVSIEVSDKNDLQLLLMLVQRLGLKFKQVEKNGASKPEKKDLEYHRNIIKTGGLMTDDRMNEMLKWLEEDRSDDARSARPS
ncbi:MAG: hypothetical protein K9J37_08360 [Saprospiraceae bacterium]|nr:hypothetical protein [Saprospiraceae bacterium]MCF8249913.1 hypothetical protein [Saprospiraceae bacterium]MCF8279326.1 hypothetical protein [Bacteroidales bacterium]MCF8310017.1 hypothetical protein [Saprospiraceae bacterium]MCF8438917.1 hypothetical protein [Saprospiraceae bacterium]